ncbi:beta-lactamase family protein [Flavobacteriaceae bacterium]|nr:beta-lactamase family protein [Flavobacteriaceae bacterium]
MKKIIFALTIIFLVSGCSQTSSTFDLPENQGVSTERLDRIDTYLNKAIEKNQIPGAVALIRRNNKIIYNKAFGYSDVENKIMYSTDDIFRIASMTKAVTSLAVLMLWEEGEFNLEDPIEKYIPEFKDLKVLTDFNETDSTYLSKPAENKISIRHLLTHTSGIGYGVIDEDARFKAIYKKQGIVDLFTTDSINIGSNVKKLAQLPLHHEPGEAFTYGESLDVLGYFIEVISQKSLDVFFKERIFDPLEMNDTYFYLPTTHQDRLVPIQTKKDGFWTKYQGDFYDTNYPVKGAKTFLSGGAGLSSTTADYSNFLQMFLNKGSFKDKQILGKKTVELVYVNQNSHIPGSSIGLAFGLVSEKDQALGGKGSMGTITWGGYFNTFYFADPVENIIGILYKQTREIEEEKTNIEFSTLLFQSLIK